MPKSTSTCDSAVYLGATNEGRTSFRVAESMRAEARAALASATALALLKLAEGDGGGGGSESTGGVVGSICSIWRASGSRRWSGAGTVTSCEPVGDRWT
jgi:hypothetical protein